MCGIVGLLTADPYPLAGPVVREMAASLRHRGPDSGGEFHSTDHRVHLGFRRLAIRDLDRRANQPFVSESGRTVIVFNGEIYNSEKLAAKYCPDLSRRTTGDTEVVVEAFERHGAQIFASLNGMFAAAIFDVHSGRVTFVRDRMGKKPLFLYLGQDYVAFASELRGLRRWGLRYNEQTVPAFLHYGYLPAPHTSYHHTEQLRPGEVVQVLQGRIVARWQFHEFCYQEWGETADAESCPQPFSRRRGTLPPAAERDEDTRLEALLDDAVAVRTISDVPIGAFLSGGVDSALVAACLARRDGPPVPTFTVSFAGEPCDETQAAARTADWLGLPHQVIPIDTSRLDELAVEYLACYEQPYADTSGLVTMLLCQAVKQHVTVALSGDGGDEFFGGYQRYRWFRQALTALRAPRLLRLGLAGAAPWLGDSRAARIGRWLQAQDAAGLYAEILRNWTLGDPHLLFPALGGEWARTDDLVRDLFRRLPAHPLKQAACFDATYYIPDDLQVKLDRASMRVSLEVRCPLLDYRVAQFGSSLPTRRLFAQGLKSVLKRQLGRSAPRDIVERPKRGFSVPLARWLTGPLRELVQANLTQSAVRQCSWWNPRAVQACLDRLLAGDKSSAHGVWLLFVLAHTVAADQQRVAPEIRSLGNLHAA